MYNELLNFLNIKDFYWFFEKIQNSNIYKYIKHNIDINSI